MMSYPKRSSFYAHRVTRLIFKSCACNEIGHYAAMLVIHIAHTEDAARYQGPVTFWNSQLAEVLGFKSPKQLNEARRRAIEAGWLHYDRDNDRKCAKYWTIIPKHVEQFDDEPIEPVILSENGKHSENGTDILSENGTHSGTHCGTHSGKPPNPDPNPKKRESAPKFQKPTLDELNEFCRAECPNVNPQKFYFYYESNGWKVGKVKMSNWKATVRGWQQRAESEKPATAPKADEEPPHFRDKKKLEKIRNGSTEVPA